MEPHLKVAMSTTMEKWFVTVCYMSTTASMLMQRAMCTGLIEWMAHTSSKYQKAMSSDAMDLGAFVCLN